MQSAEGRHIGSNAFDDLRLRVARIFKGGSEDLPVNDLSNGKRRWEEIYKEEGIPDDLKVPYGKLGMIIDDLKGHGVENVLDVAMGAGVNAAKLARTGFKVSGFDSSPTALGLAAHIFSTNKLQIEGFSLGDMFDTWDYADNEFDGAVAIRAIYHGTPEQTKFAIDEIHRVVRGGGRVGMTFSMVPGRSTLGAEVYEGEEVDYKTWVPKVGREKGVKHFYPDIEDIKKMLGDSFTEVKMDIDEETGYIIVMATVVKGNEDVQYNTEMTD